MIKLVSQHQRKKGKKSDDVDISGKVTGSRRCWICTARSTSMVWRKVRWCARGLREFRGISNFGAEHRGDSRTQFRYQTVSISLLHHVKLCTLQDVGGGGGCLGCRYLVFTCSVSNQFLGHGPSQSFWSSWSVLKLECQHRRNWKKSVADYYGVATISRLLIIIGLFCKRALLKRLYSTKETYNFKEPTKCSHPILVVLHHN